jgi:hypothetical protein
VDWAERLGRSRAYDPACEQLIATADVLDAIYQRQPVNAAERGAGERFGS